MTSTSVIGHGGTRLHVEEVGPPDAPAILFIHGWSQCHLSWRNQLRGPLAERFRLIAFDLRGHGMSDRPTDEDAYRGGEPWAADVDALIRQRGLVRPVLVAWSFGGYVAAYYLQAHGDAAIAGIDFVGWAIMTGPTERERAFTGPGFQDHFEGTISADLGTNIEATRQFVRACVAAEPTSEEMETMLAYNMMVSPFIRRAVALQPPVDNSALLSSLRVPVLYTHGAQDSMVRAVAVDHIRRCCPAATVSIFEGAGHSPFWERPAQFDEELARFTLAANEQTPPTGPREGSKT